MTEPKRSSLLPKVQAARDVLTPLLTLLSEVVESIKSHIAAKKDDMELVCRFANWMNGVTGLRATVIAVLGEFDPFLEAPIKNLDAKGSILGASLAMISCASICEQVQAVLDFFRHEGLLGELEPRFKETIKNLQRVTAHMKFDNADR